MSVLTKISRAARLLAVVLLWVLCSGEPAFSSEPIIGATFGTVTANKATMGDVWSSTWAADGSLYSLQDDFFFPNGSANMGVNRLDGDDPLKLTYTLINTMKEYGTAGQEFGADRGSWKAVGIISIENTLYLSVTRAVSWSSANKSTQRAVTVDASILKSTDRGQTWTRSSEENFKHPMFPGTRFSNPVFIQYGQNASAKANGSDRYVYAVSNDGAWSHADYLILGRVLRSKIGDLKSSDWEFYQGDGRDGMRSSEWTREAKQATPILRDPQNLGWTNVMYIPQTGRYLMGQWHWLKGRWHQGECTWILREAPTPWGPWTPVATQIWDMYHDYYFPAFVPKFVSDDGLHLYVFTAGWGKYWSILYRLHVIPIDLHTRRSVTTSRSHLEFRETMAETKSSSQSVEVHLGDGRAASELRVQSVPPWLTTSIDSTDNFTRVMNQVNTAALSPGEYSGEVTLLSPMAEPAVSRYSVSLRVLQPHDGLSVAQTKPGVLYEYYAFPELEFNGESSQLANFGRLGLVPGKSGVCAVPSLSCGDNEAKSFIHFAGYFVALYPGEYTFFLNSQDGSRLTVADELVVDNDGYHAAYEQTGSVWLREGLHRFAVDFFQASEPGLLRIDVRVPGQPRRPLEAADLVHVE